MNRKRLISEVSDNNATNSMFCDDSPLGEHEFKIEGCIQKVNFPKNLSEYKGWASLGIINPKTKITYSISGNVPFIDYAYLYTFHCKVFTKTVKKKDNKGKLIVSNFQEKKIINTVNVAPQPFTLDLLKKLLRVYNILPQIQILNLCTSLPSNTTIEDIKKYSWFQKLKECTPYFSANDATDLMRYFGFSKKLLSISTKDFNNLVDILKRQPHRLCCHKLHSIEGIPMMSVDTLQECYKKFSIKPCEPYIAAALKFYQTVMYEMMDTQGSTFLDESDYKKMKISNKAKEFLVSNEILVKHENNYYHCDAWQNKNDIVNFMSEMLQKPIDTPETPEKKATPFNLDAEQQKCVDLCKTSHVVCITGAAGCGKTTVLMEVLNHCNKKVLLLAPRGVAARKVAKVTDSRAITIDKMIEIVRISIEKDQQNPFEDIELVIVEEASMKTENHLASLGTFLPNLTQLFLVGDCNQICPIGSGFPYRDFIKTYPAQTIYLKTNHRVDPNCLQLIHLSNCILNKTPRLIKASRTYSATEPVIFIQREQNLMQQIKSLLKKFPDHSEIQMITHLNDTRRNLNEMYLKTYHSSANPVSLFTNLKIMILKNKNAQYDIDKKIFSADVCNGDIDFIESIKDVLYKVTEKGQIIEEDVVNLADTTKPKIPGYRRIIDLKNSGQRIDLEYVGKNNIIPAYCITGDKSQGEEFKRVILVLDKNKANRLSENLVPSLLYTMVTRSKQQIVVVCDLNPKNSFGEFERVIMAHKEMKRNHNLYKFLPLIE